MTLSLRNLQAPAFAPSILTADFGQLANEIQAAEAAGVDLIHLDVMDGSFVPNLSFGPLVVEAVRKVTKLPLDVHLMIEQPERYIDAFASAGADVITIHVEATRHTHRAIEMIGSSGCNAGIALNPGTPVSAVSELIALVDLVLVMTVNPGFGGQAFLNEMQSKISSARQKIDSFDSEALLEVDGGIKAETIADAFRAGAEVFVCGSSLFNDEVPIEEALKRLRAAIGH
jgi:ribulose-phosphate 3-epimerase